MTGSFALHLDPEDGIHPDDDARWAGVSKIMGPRWAHLPTLTVGLMGVQIYWSVEFSYASPYLLSLGLSKSLMAIVFLAGPVSGLVMQPLIGVLADNSKSRFGRRRPYMIGGTMLCMFAMLLLGYTRPIAAIFTGSGNHANDVLTIWLAVLSIYLIDFTINAVQAVDRALLVDTLPTPEQANGNAWAAMMLGLGSVIGFFIGNLDLQKRFSWLGGTQLEVMAVIASLLLLSLHSVTAFAVKERVLLAYKNGRKSKTVFQEIKEIFTNMRTLPRTIRQICIIQFFAWIGWFPVLFYSTLYVGDIHRRNSVPPAADDDLAIAALDAQGTRLGSRALFYSSLLALMANIALPFFVAEAQIKPGPVRSASSTTPHSTMISPAIGGKGRGWFERIQVHLISLWAASHLIFATCMLATFFTSSVTGATILITITGFSWAITQWAPFSLLAEAILTEPAVSAEEDAGSIRLADTRTRTQRVLGGGVHNDDDDDERQVFLAPEDGDEDRGNNSRGSSIELTPDPDSRHHSIMGNPRAQLSLLNVDTDGDRDASRNGGGLSGKAGIILGIHNVFIVVPQFLVTGLASIIFAIFDPEKSVLHGKHPGNTLPTNSTSSFPTLNETTTALLSSREKDPLKDGTNSVAIIFRIGGLSAAIAFILCWRLARELRHR